METIIFRDSPLAEYLEGNGEAEDDWGVDPSTFIDPMEPSQSFAPVPLSLPSRLRAKSIKALRLNEPGWRQRNYLYELFSKVIDSRLSKGENARFLERFRYIIIASQLLSEHINVSHYNRRSGEFLSPPTDDDSESSAFFGPRFAKVRYWAGNSVCIGLVTLLVSWVLKWGESQVTQIERSRAGIGLLGISVVFIILFTNARRRWLRTLRGRTIELATQFVETSQNYEVLASNAITFIQEVELVSRGYRLSTPLPPVTRIERDSQTKRCARLRRALLSSISRTMGPHNKGFIALRQLAQATDLEKYYDIYDIRQEDLEIMEVEIQESEFDGMDSLKALKYLLQRLHTLRKVFLCCLLAFDANGGHSDFATWRAVVEQLKTLGTLMADVGEALRRQSEEEQRFNTPPTPTSKGSMLSPTRERWRGQLRKLNSLSQSLRGLQAKMQVLREESDRTLQESLDLVEFGPDLLAHYDSIGTDLHALVTEWENGRAMLVMSIDKQGGDTSSNRNSLMSLMSPTIESLSGDTPRNSWGALSPTSESMEAVEELKEKEEEDDGQTELIFEGVAEPRVQRQKSNLTREERIRLVQEERMRLIEERKKQETGVSLVKELQTVLVNRPQHRRVSARQSLQ